MPLHLSYSFGIKTNYNRYNCNDGSYFSFVDWIGSITTIMDAIRSLPKYITLICGNLFVGAGIGLYVSTNLCAAPQEAFVLTVAEKKNGRLEEQRFH